MGLPRYREVFDPRRSFVAARRLTVSGEEVAVGAPIDKRHFTWPQLKRLFGARHIRYVDETLREMARFPNPRRVNMREPPKSDGPPRRISAAKLEERRRARAQTEVPVAWWTLSYNEQKRLANIFSDEPVYTKDQIATVLRAAVHAKAA